MGSDELTGALINRAEAVIVVAFLSGANPQSQQNQPADDKNYTLGGGFYYI